ncbi:DNA cytosine methyltransferase [Nisaea acidiphila]|uniref:Cytosine-specific methyltransferase n=1 Tax=Nisaea acidiphila TaxID=1862145 RepID=A0A9J7AYH5_9PROT|nr:DNA cytosine methyltransferase [Nisaea acidiphila]UUX51842.1 DNA cytosine methyltransferase [Nisaea acidiphila]
MTANQPASYNKVQQDQLTAIDLFCGSGAVTLGLKNAGFSVAAAVEIDLIASETYRANHPEVHLIRKDICDVDLNVDLPTKFPSGVDVIAVCAPCQPFSNRNRARSESDSRVALVLEALKFIKHFKPRVVFVENVPGLERNMVFERFSLELISLGYSVGHPHTLDAADVGVPQRRPRMTLVAAKDRGLLEKISGIDKEPYATVRDAIGDLGTPPSIKSETPPSDPMHVSRQHHPITMKRLKHIPKDGGSRDALPDYLVLACHRNLKPNQFPDSYGRMRWDDVAPTLTTGCTDLTRGRYAHPEEDRAITLREAARLQTFPDTYIFAGNAAQIASQIGNAVPPKMMKSIAGRFASCLLKP